LQEDEMAATSKLPKAQHFLPSVLESWWLKIFHNDFQGILGWVGGELDGGGGLIQRKAAGDEAAHVEAAGKDEAGDFVLQREVGGIAANEVFFVEADGGQIK